MKFFDLLFHSRGDEGCFLCLQIMQRHTNVLQYKDSKFPSSAEAGVRKKVARCGVRKYKTRRLLSRDLILQPYTEFRAPYFEATGHFPLSPRSKFLSVWQSEFTGEIKSQFLDGVTPALARRAGPWVAVDTLISLITFYRTESGDRLDMISAGNRVSRELCM